MEEICLIEPGSIIKLTVSDKLRNKESNEEIMHQATKGKRLDTYISENIPSYSRSFFHKLIKDKKVKVNSKIINKPSYKLNYLDQIEVQFPLKPDLPELNKHYEDLGVKIIYTDPHFLIAYKPAGMIVHKPQENSTCFTLSDWLIHHFKEISQVGASDRPGIVHRLDKDTSGILIIPRNEPSHAIFSKLFKDREINKTYLAIVKGHPDAIGEIDEPISRDPIHGYKMTTKIRHGRESLTRYKVLEYFKDTSLLEVYPTTGRTHQIRVHLSSIGHPIVGDSVYGEESKLINRQALHAHKLEFNFNNQHYEFSQEAPEDMQNLVKVLREI